jgi:chaperonin GroEL
MKEKKARVEDAMHATRAAVEEGIVAGGGVALIRSAKDVDELVKTLVGDEKIGAQIVRRAIEEPLRQIVGNAGEEGAVVVGKILENKDPNFGYNAATNEYEDLVTAARAVRSETQCPAPTESPRASEGFLVTTIRYIRTNDSSRQAHWRAVIQAVYSG